MSGKLRSFKPVILVLPLLVASIPAVMADVTAGPSGELTVKGQFTPIACQAILASNGTIDYGLIQSSSLNNNTTTDLPVKTLASAITVNCPAATSVAFAITDNRSSSVTPPENPAARKALLPNSEQNQTPLVADSALFLGLGVDGANHNIGNYVAQFNNAKVDGASAGFSTSGIFNSSPILPYAGVYAYTMPYNDAAYNMQSNTSDGVFGELSVGKVFVIDYQVQPTIEPSKNLDLTKEITLDGSVTVSLYYL